jgi:fluoride exporter
MNTLAIGVGGALGAIARYALGSAVHRVIPGSFPYGTFIVNVIGCLTFGLVIALAESRFVDGPATRAFLLVGVLGGFTTFSSFTFETLELLRGGQVVHAAVNVIGQIALGLFALWGGIVLGRAI